MLVSPSGIMTATGKTKSRATSNYITRGKIYSDAK